MIKYYHLLLYWLYVILLLTACRDEEHIVKPLLPPTGNEAMISLTLNISGFREVGTRALNETGVNSFIVLLLADRGGRERVKAK